MPLAAGQPVGSSTAPGWVTESTRNTQVPSTGAITTGELVIQTITWTAVSTARYKLIGLQSAQSTVAGDIMRMRVRYQAGATLTTSGTELVSLLPVAYLASKGALVPILCPTLTGIFGQYTIGVTLARDTGATGNLVSYGDVKQINTLILERV